jgi:hypothetical protein
MGIISLCFLNYLTLFFFVFQDVAIPLLGVFRTIENVGVEKCHKLIGNK